uniref:Uncharacterized protein n=1 Tax=Triticum urartu TaxID=4572 RepID=A0A8R7PII5_TRIUA
MPSETSGAGATVNVGARTMVGGGARQHHARARRAERGEPPRQDLYDQGGDSLCMSTVVQSCGTPLAIPLLLYFGRRPKATTTAVTRPPLLKISAIYAGLGIPHAGDNLMYSYALLYLPLSS